MKRVIFFVMALALVGTQMQAQQYKYYVHFTDKDGSPYTLSEPTAFLSQRSIDRRTAKGIALDSLDLPVNPSYVQQAAAAVNATVRYTLRWLNGAVIATPSAINTATLNALPFVDTAFCVSDSPDGPMGSNLTNSSWSGETYSSDVPFSDDWYGNHWLAISDLGGDQVNRAGYTGAGVMVGISSFGFYNVDQAPALARLRDEGRIVATRDFDDPDRSVYTPQYDRGTVLIQTMAAYQPGFYIGCAYDASFVLTLSENNSYEQPVEAYSLVAVYEYFDSIGVDLVICDLGYQSFDMASQSFQQSQMDGQSTFVTRALNVASDKGMAFFGNVYDQSMGGLYAPFDALGMMICGGIHGNGTPQEGMLHGPTIDGRIKPDVCVFNDYFLTSRGGFVTSRYAYSVANVAALAACVLQKHPEWTAWQLQDSIRAWGSNAASPNNEVGWGSPDFSKMLDPSEVGIETNPELRVFEIYPNPATEMITIAGNIENTNVEILDMMGRIILTHKATNSREVRLNVSNLDPGLYIVRTRTADGTTCAATISLMAQ